MITTFLLNILQITIDGVLFLFSQLGPIPSDSAIVTGISTISSYLSPLGNILPMTAILSILAFELIFESSYLAYKFIRWAYTKIPLVN